MKLNHAQTVKDYRKLVQMYDIPENLNGSMFVEETLMEAVEKGTKNSCAKAILSIIEYGFKCSDNEIYHYQDGSSYSRVSIFDCDFIKYIADTYLN